MMDAYTHLDLAMPDPAADIQNRLREAGATEALAVETWDGSNREELQRILRIREEGVRVALCFRRQTPTYLTQLLHNPRLAALRCRASSLADNSDMLGVLARSGRWLLIQSEDGAATIQSVLERALRVHPSLKVYVPHFGWPRVRGADDEHWTEAMTALSRHPNLIVGLSAVEHFSREAFPHRDIRPFAVQLLGLFGPTRVVVGTDFPNCARDNYGESLRLVRRWIRAEIPTWSDANALSTD